MGRCFVVAKLTSLEAVVALRLPLFANTSNNSRRRTDQHTKDGVAVQAIHPALNDGAFRSIPVSADGLPPRLERSTNGGRRLGIDHAKR